MKKKIFVSDIHFSCVEWKCVPFFNDVVFVMKNIRDKRFVGGIRGGLPISFFCRKSRFTKAVGAGIRVLEINVLYRSVVFCFLGV